MKIKTYALIGLLLISFYSFNQVKELWGVTGAALGGGESGPGLSGTIYKVDINGDNHEVVHYFDSVNGELPQSIIQISSGKIYGTTYVGGTSYAGVIFEIDPVTGEFTKKMDFDTYNTGNQPVASLVETQDGKLYGTTQFGGAHHKGVLYEWDPVLNVFTKKRDFDGIGLGAHPGAGLVYGSNGKIYGLTAAGGDFGHGVLFEYDISLDSFTKLVDFDSLNTGMYPRSNLFETNEGLLFGGTRFGGLHNKGVLFAWDITSSSFIKKIDFDGELKGQNCSSIYQADNGKLIGTTFDGGLNNGGVLFEWDNNLSLFTKKMDFDTPYELFDGHTGCHPAARLMQASSGDLFGVTGEGGLNHSGVLFKWNINSNEYSNKVEFDYTNLELGFNPRSSLIEISVCRDSYSVATELYCRPLQSPSGNYLYDEPGIYIDTIANYCGMDSIITTELLESFETISASNDMMYSTSLSAHTYQWVNCNDYSIIPGATNPTYSASSDGNYALIITQDDCVDTSECINFVLSDFNQTYDSDLHIYPNPSNGLVNVTTDVIGGYISIYSIDGKIIKSGIYISSKETSIDLSSIKAGTYFLKLKGDNQEYVERIVIK